MSGFAVAAAALVVAIVAIGAAALAISLGDKSPAPIGKGASSAARTTPHSAPTKSPASTRPSGHTTSPRSTSPTHPTTTTPAGPGPHLASVSPAAAAAGQTVTISGTDLYSSNGVITADVGTTAAAIECPQQTTCTVTVPDLGTAPLKTTIALVTATGTSNTVAFTYR